MRTQPASTELDPLALPMHSQIAVSSKVRNSAVMAWPFGSKGTSSATISLRCLHSNRMVHKNMPFLQPLSIAPIRIHHQCTDFPSSPPQPPVPPESPTARQSHFAWASRSTFEASMLKSPTKPHQGCDQHSWHRWHRWHSSPCLSSISQLVFAAYT